MRPACLAKIELPQQKESHNKTHQQGSIATLFQSVNKVVNSPRRKGRVCAGNLRRVSCAIEILSFQNFYKVLKTCSAGRKDFFDTLQQGSIATLFFCVLMKKDYSNSSPSSSASVFRYLNTVSNESGEWSYSVI